MSRLAMVLATAALGAAIGTGPARPAAAQVDIRQFLQGLMTGDPREDDALRNAFERGYERGRRDEAQRQRAIREQRREDRSAQREWERDEAWRDQHDPSHVFRPDGNRR